MDLLDEPIKLTETDRAALDACCDFTGEEPVIDYARLPPVVNAAIDRLLDLLAVGGVYIVTMP